MEKLVTVAIAGLGSRGRDTYAQLAKQWPERMKIVAVADPEKEKRELAAQEFGIPEEFCFDSAESLLGRDRLADALIIATQDRQHVGHAIPALEKGYDILLEKPVSPLQEECTKLARAARKYQRKVVVCHVLRYTPLYQKVKELLDMDSIGEVVSISAMENVGWFHMAHSFVRGNWANSGQTSPMILQKCCHDLDLYLWLAKKTCKSITSYGSTYLFREEKAPEGSTLRCMDGCKAKGNCPFDAESIYLDNQYIGYRSGNRKWPLDVLVPSGPDEEKIKKALRTGRYGRCVYHCDNNVPDHQVVNLNMTDGTTMSLTMCGLTADISRYAKFMGTKGELVVSMRDADESFISIREFAGDFPEKIIHANSLSDDFSGHGGGEQKMLEEFLDLITGAKEESPYLTSLDRSLESHFCALAAEYSRLHGGEPVLMEDFVNP